MLLNVRALTLDKWNSKAPLCIHLTSETLTWDLTTSLFEEPEASMTNYASNIVPCSGKRGRGNAYVINSISTLTVDLVDIIDVDNFHNAFLLGIQIFTTSLNEHVRPRKTAHIDHMTLATWWMITLESA